MKQEDKELILKDLCARLPYETMIQVSAWTIFDTILKPGHIAQLMNNDIKLKPYLRPLSSMTEEEKNEHFGRTMTIDIVKTSKEVIDWLNAHHFDYRGLIEKGLAIEVTEEDNPYKE